MAPRVKDSVGDTAKRLNIVLRCVLSSNELVTLSQWREEPARIATAIRVGSSPLTKIFAQKKEGIKPSFLNGSSGGTRTYNPSVNSRMLCH